MLRFSKCLLCPVFSALTALAAAQTQQTTQRVASQQPPSSGITLHAGTQLVIVDVVVTDSHQEPVHNLKASDFTLLERNLPQQIKNFEEHKALPPAEAAKLPPMPVMPPGIFTNYSPAPRNGVLNVLLLDTLNTPMRDQAYVRDQLRKYLKNAGPTEPHRDLRPHQSPHPPAGIHLRPCSSQGRNRTEKPEGLPAARRRCWRRRH